MYPALIVYYSLLLLINVLSVIRWKHFKLPEKILASLIALTIAAELAALAAKTWYSNNLTVYHVYSPMELFMVCLYFNYSVEILKRRNTGIWVGCVGLIVSLANTLFIQKSTTINSYFLLFEATVIIIFSLISFYQIVMEEDYSPARFAHFWITICFLLYWSATFTGWGIYNVLDPEDFVLNPIFDKVLTAANYGFYIGIALIFIRYKKLIPSGE